MTVSLLNPPGTTKAGKDKPNIIFIMADDMGYSDLGCYGSEIKTPNLDKLAANGLKLRSFYNNSRCCPTRASLLTGQYPHQVGIGQMVTLANAKYKPGSYQGFLDDKYPTIAEALKKVGYGTYMSGKWHVGERKEHWPRKRGFDRYYGLISGASSFYEITPQERAKRFFVLNDEEYAIPSNGHYMTDAFTDQAMAFLDEHQKNRKDDPFFLYLAYTAPHFPLHAFEEDIVKYEKIYSKGWDKIRSERFQRMKEIGLIDNRYALTDKPEHIPSWESVGDKADWVRKMAVYAAMIDRMDQNIGRLVEQLKQTGQYDNTVIVFLSDNGACAETVNTKLLNDPSTKIGERGSYTIYGEPWANVSGTPFKKYKHYMHEGGINTSFIIQWPGGIKPGKGFHDGYGHVMDLLPTSLELAGADPLDVPGKSLSHLWTGKKNPERKIFWEHEGNRAVRWGNWKLVQELEDESWALYNLKDDPTEVNDLSAKKPALVVQLQNDYDVWAAQVGVRKVSKVKDVVITTLGAKGDGITIFPSSISDLPDLHMP
jgi:arylsulfatase